MEIALPRIFYVGLAIDVAIEGRHPRGLMDRKSVYLTCRSPTLSPKYVKKVFVGVRDEQPAKIVCRDDACGALGEAKRACFPRCGWHI